MDKAKEINEEYKVVDKIAGAASAGIAKAKDINERHHVVEKVGTIASVRP